MVDLLRRAWDALNTFKQTYPENWHEEDEQVLKDLMRADLKLSGVEQKVEELEQRPWVGLTDEEIDSLQRLAIDPVDASGWGFLNRERYARLIEAKLKEKNT